MTPLLAFDLWLAEQRRARGDEIPNAERVRAWKRILAGERVEAAPVERPAACVGAAS